MSTLISVKDLKPGDRVDLQGDPIANFAGDNSLLANEYQVVDSLEPEGPDCICVYFENFTCGFPSGHQVRLAPAAENKHLLPSQSNRTVNPNHPLIRCVDGTGPHGEWTTADDTYQTVTGPYRVFDVLNQRHVGPKFRFRIFADLFLRFLGGSHVKI